MYNTQLFYFRYYFLFLIAISNTLYAQSPWSGAYGNEWLDAKYSQNWLRIGVSQNGIQRVTLPLFFQNKAHQLHLYHRGIEVALISSTNTEIEFYGVVNDGESDKFLYRPYTGKRQNPYYSFFSDEGVYFLTISSSVAKRSEIQPSIAYSGNPDAYHMQKELKTYTEMDTYDGSNNLVFHTLDQSYFVEGKGRSSKLIYKRTGDKPSGDPVFPFPFQLKNLYKDGGVNASIEVLFNGRTFSNNIIKASIGKTATTLGDYSNLIQFSDFTVLKKEFGINISSDVDASGQGHFQLESTKVTDQSGTTGIFSVNYIRLIYPQKFDMTGVNAAIFNLIPTSNSTSTVTIKNAPANLRIYDVTDVDNPRIIQGAYDGTSMNLVIARKPNQELNLLVTNEIKNLGAEKANTVSFTKFDPTGADYIIITNETLWTAANEYAAYRKSSIGGENRTLVVKIKDIYNQFNYGEPSPVAIRRFMDYMIHNNPREKHNLLLVGPSTTLSAKLIGNRELKEDVPTIGFPGSDVLLVEGLTSSTANVPTIPVGRINAIIPEQVSNYLNKVKDYEQNLTSVLWRKRVLHVNGGKSASEISQFKTFLSSLAPIVEDGEVGGNVKAIVKQSTLPVEKANISSDVNEGVGMISYMGHGDPDVTDLDMGYISDAANSYQNLGKYPLLYFNGCGVGNIFNGRNNPSPTATDRLPQSSDWINSSNKGGIAVIANSYYSFQASSSRYLKELYDLIFGSVGSKLTIGQIQKKAAVEITAQNVTDYDIANIHQSLLQGDPVLRLIKVDQPNYSVSKDEGIMLVSESDDKSLGQSKVIRTGVIIANGGKYIKDQSVPLQLKYFFVDGTSTVLNQTSNPIAFQDTMYVTVNNSKPLSKVSVTVDPENILMELNEDDNYSELTVDWEKAKSVNVYPAERAKDVIPPMISVLFNNAKIKNEEVLAPNPVIKISLLDDRNLSADTTLLDVFIKRCGDDNCDFERVSINDNKVKMTLTTDGILMFDYVSSNLSVGTYELLVSGKDRSGNATIQPLKLKFRIEEPKDESISITVSPNPASDYLHFELKATTASYKSIKLLIYDGAGRIISTKIIDPALRSWYFMLSNQTSGLLVYKVLLSDEINQESVYSGKIAVFK